MTEQQWIQIYRDTVHPFYGYTARRTGGNRILAGPPFVLVSGPPSRPGQESLQ